MGDPPRARQTLYASRRRYPRSPVPRSMEVAVSARPSVLCAVAMSTVLAFAGACSSNGKEDATREVRKNSTTAGTGPTGVTGPMHAAGPSGATGPAPKARPVTNSTPSGVSGDSAAAAACARLPKGEVSGIVGFEVREVEVSAETDSVACSWSALDGTSNVVKLEHGHASDPTSARAICEYMSTAISGAQVDPEGLGTAAYWSSTSATPETPSSITGRFGLCLNTGAVFLIIRGPIGEDVIQGYARQVTKRFLELLATPPAS